ncbi:MAG: hypothetical protein ACI9IA_002362, partial [Enterobacterales bacterium]
DYPFMAHVGLVFLACTDSSSPFIQLVVEWVLTLILKDYCGFLGRAQGSFLRGEYDRYLRYLFAFLSVYY